MAKPRGKLRTLTYKEIVGRHIKEARRSLEMTQTELGVQLGLLLNPPERGRLGKPWSAQAVSGAEQGRRDFTAEELGALTRILGRPVSFFFQLPEDVGAVAFPGVTAVRETLPREVSIPAHVANDLLRILHELGASDEP